MAFTKKLIQVLFNLYYLFYSLFEGNQLEIREVYLDRLIKNSTKNISFRWYPKKEVNVNKVFNFEYFLYKKG